MEGNILNALNFNITVSSQLLFLERYAKLLQVQQKTYFMARYLIELSLVEYGMLNYSARKTAVSALYLACKINKCTPWNELIEESSNFKETDVRPCAKALCIILQNAPKSNLKACRRKFSHLKYKEVSKIKIAS